MDFGLLTKWLLAVPGKGDFPISFETGTHSQLGFTSDDGDSEKTKCSQTYARQHQEATIILVVFKTAILGRLPMDYGNMRPLLRCLACTSKFWKKCVHLVQMHMYDNRHVLFSDSVAVPPVSSRQFRQELIHLQVGQCGNQLGTSFWKAICAEHGFNQVGACTGQSDLPLDCVSTYFNLTPGGRYLPRAILVDLEPTTVDAVLADSAGKLFCPDNVICGQIRAATMWWVGHYTEGAEIIDVVFDAIRRESERCDSLQGFQLVHSLGGGTGSGLGSLITCRLRDEYPDRMNLSFSVFPSPKVSDCVIEPYNAMLTIHHLIENVDACIVVDNEALYDIHHRHGQHNCAFADLNRIATRALVNVSSGFRLPDRMNHTSLRKLLVNMVPFPRAHFLTCSSAPAQFGEVPVCIWNSVELVQQAFRECNLLCACHPNYGRYLAATLMLRGDFLLTEAAQKIIDMRRKPNLFASFIPDNVKINACRLPSHGGHLRRECALLANTTSIQEVFRRVDEQFSALWRRKAFLHSANLGGMDEMEFQESHTNVQDLMSEYQFLQEATDGVDNCSDYESDC